MNTLSQRYIDALQQLDVYAATATRQTDAVQDAITGARVSVMATSSAETEDLLVVTTPGAMPRLVHAQLYFKLQLLRQARADAVTEGVDPAERFSVLSKQLRGRYRLP